MPPSNFSFSDFGEVCSQREGQEGEGQEGRGKRGRGKRGRGRRGRGRRGGARGEMEVSWRIPLAAQAHTV